MPSNASPSKRCCWQFVRPKRASRDWESCAALPDWSLCEVLDALMAIRGIDMISATGFLAEIGDLSRFRTPRELMAYLGLVPSEHSTGDRVRRGAITNAGNGRARRIVVECSW